MTDLLAILDLAVRALVLLATMPISLALLPVAIGVAVVRSATEMST